MEVKTWSRGYKQTYTDRPLTDEEREFASDWENYKKLFEIMRYYKLDEEEWYDILIIPYLQAVKKYHVREDLRKNYKFFHVLHLMLTKAVYNHNRHINRQNQWHNGIVSLDYTLLGDNPFSEYTIEELWIDHKQQVERVVLDTYMLENILIGLNDVQTRIFKMLLEGYSRTEISKQLSISYVTLKAQLEKLQKVVSDYLSI